MTARIAIVLIGVVVLSIYASKDWFKSLCGLIVLMGVMASKYMPTNLFGIQGFNPWNILFLAVFLGWLASRRREGVTWDMPGHIKVLLLLYLAVILLGFGRAVLDRSNLEDYPLKNLISEELINTVKWVLPGILLFDGGRTRRRLMWALACVLTIYVLVALQVTREVPSDSVLEDSSALIVDRMEVNGIGYNADNTSAMLAGAFWGTLAVLPLASGRHRKALIAAAAGIIVFGQALTGGRAGYVAWGGVGLVLCLLKWRKQLILAPVVVLLLPHIFPGATRLMQLGFDEIDAAGQATTDDRALTSDRNLIWPLVIDKIRESPMIGHGRLAMKRTGLMGETEKILGEGEGIGHAHNLYLETLLDNGIMGSLPIFLFWGTILTYSARLFRSSNRLYSAVGGLAMSLVLAQAIAGMGSLHVYPMEETFGMWTAVFLMMRVYVEEKRAQFNGLGAEARWSMDAFPEHRESAVSAHA
jgi:O-antigen ligase